MMSSLCSVMGLVRGGAGLFMGVACSVGDLLTICSSSTGLPFRESLVLCHVVTKVLH